MLFAVVVLSSLVALSQATPTKDTITVCKHLQSKHPQYFAWDPLGPYAQETAANATLYNTINSLYYNAQNSLNRAACVFFPGDAQQVSDAVLALNEFPSVKFALKSGGHQPAPGSASTDQGVLISFAPNLASTVRTPEGEHFVVGAGSRWGEVYNVTGKTNQVVVGGRLSDIGVGGLLLGGGLSYYSTQHGLACDNVDNFEAVLANGTIVNANRASNPDLWWALRGGGNQFAIVTRFTLRAYPAGIDGQIWGGARTYAPDQHRALSRALTNFVREYPDAKAALVPTFEFGIPGNVLNMTEEAFVLFFYDGPTPPPGVFDELDAIESRSDDTQTRSYLNLTQYLNGGAIYGLGTSFNVNAFPNLPGDQTVEFLDMYYNASSAQSLDPSLTGLTLQYLGFVPQPMPVRIAEASQRQGGNALNLDPAHGDRFWIEFSLIWLAHSCDEQCPEVARQTTNQMLQFSKDHYAGTPPTNYESGDLDFVSYNPLFLNDAAPSQDVYTSYGEENLARLQYIKKAYDPTGFFTNRQGGFKLPQ